MKSWTEKYVESPDVKLGAGLITPTTGPFVPQTMEGRMSEGHRVWAEEQARMGKPNPAAKTSMEKFTEDLEDEIAYFKKLTSEEEADAYLWGVTRGLLRCRRILRDCKESGDV